MVTMEREHRPHDWDFRSWQAAAPGETMRCGHCGFRARTDGVDTPQDCECNIGETHFDGSDHQPGCKYFSEPSCTG